MSASKIEHSYTILLPISGEALGRWLEKNNAIINISCMLGTYHVSVNRRSSALPALNSSLSGKRSSARPRSFGCMFRLTCRGLS